VERKDEDSFSEKTNNASILTTALVFFSACENTGICFLPKKQ